MIGAGELQKAAFDHEIRQPFAQMHGEAVEFLDGGGIAAAVAADHDGAAFAGGIGGRGGGWSVCHGRVVLAFVREIGHLVQAFGWHDAVRTIGTHRGRERGAPGPKQLGPIAAALRP